MKKKVLKIETYSLYSNDYSKVVSRVESNFENFMRIEFFIIKKFSVIFGTKKIVYQTKRHIQRTLKQLMD